MKPRIGTTPYIDHSPQRVAVYNSDYDEECFRMGRDRTPWVVEIGGRLLGSYSTHAQAIERAAREAK